MKRLLRFTVLLLLAGATCLSAGCRLHASPVREWYFFDRKTGLPVDSVLLLEWAEKEVSSSPEAMGFERQVPSTETLQSIRAAELTRTDPTFRPTTRTRIHSYAVTVWEGARFMAVHPAYGFRVQRASEEQLARLPVEIAAEESIAYVVLTHETDPAMAADWLHWLANGQSLVARDLPGPLQGRLYQAFAAYWDRTAAEQGPQLYAELGSRPPEVAAELERIYRDELSRPPPPRP